MVVQGSGPVGMAAAIYARICGAKKIVMVGGPANRLKVAKDMGIADMTLDIFTVTDRAERIKRGSGGNNRQPGRRRLPGVHRDPAAVPEGFEMVRRKGHYLMLGQYTDKGPILINPHVITKKQLTSTGSWARSEVHDLKYVESLPEIKKRIDLGSLVTSYAMKDINAAIESVRAGKVMKAALKF